MSADLDTRRSTLMRIFHKAGGGVAGWEAVAVWTLEQEAKVIRQERADA